MKNFDSCTMNAGSTEDLIYRRGGINDIQQLKNLGVISYGQYVPLLTPDNREKLYSFLYDDKGWQDLISLAVSFVCVDEDTIVGMAYLIPQGHPTDIYPADWCYIRMVGVHPHYKGKGIARKLTSMCIQKARELNEKIIGLHTSEFMDAARHIYESLGFTIVKEIPPRYGKKYWLYKLAL
jgi:ribosomal protein S18 acetylase RimI-like enzyme